MRFSQATINTGKLKQDVILSKLKLISTQNIVPLFLKSNYLYLELSYLDTFLLAILLS